MLIYPLFKKKKIIDFIAFLIFYSKLTFTYMSYNKTIPIKIIHRIFRTDCGKKQNCLKIFIVKYFIFEVCMK